MSNSESPDFSDDDSNDDKQKEQRISIKSIKKK